MVVIPGVGMGLGLDFMIETYEYDIAEKALGDFNSRVDAFFPTRKKGMVIWTFWLDVG